MSSEMGISYPRFVIKKDCEQYDFLKKEKKSLLIKDSATQDSIDCTQESFLNPWVWNTEHFFLSKPKSERIWTQISHLSGNILSDYW